MSPPQVSSAPFSVKTLHQMLKQLVRNLKHFKKNNMVSINDGYHYCLNFRNFTYMFMVRQTHSRDAMIFSEMSAVSCGVSTTIAEVSSNHVSSQPVSTTSSSSTTSTSGDASAPSECCKHGSFYLDYIFELKYVNFMPFVDFFIL